MIFNTNFISTYDELSQINENMIDEKFDTPGAEAVYGEEATTIAGVLRYFVEDIPTLAAIISRGRIKAAQQKETDTNSPLGDKNHKRRSFVSFSRQLFSHAYRAPKKWKYGVAIDQKTLEAKTQQMAGLDICPDFDHPGNNMMVFGAAKLEDSTDLLVTSFGSFIMNLNEQTRNLLKQHQNVTLEKTNFYTAIKSFFDEYIKENSSKKKEVKLSYTEDITEVEKLIVKRRRLESPVIEGFILESSSRSHILAPRFTELCARIPGLSEYLKEHTNLNEGEFRIWVAEGQQYLDISDCIVGIVLPSNYKENNLDNEQNTAPDVLWLRRLIKEQDLTVYVYKSDEGTNIPNIDLSKKYKRTLEKPSIVEYFHKITGSKDAVINFIKNELTQYNFAQSGINAAYNAAVAKNTTSAQLDVATNDLYNYKAFLNAITEYGLTLKDVSAIYKTGKPLANAYDVFNEKTKSIEDVQAFLKQLTTEFPNMPLFKSYCTWFANNTNANREGDTLTPVEINWRSFADYCKQTFNYTPRDLTALSKGQQFATERAPIKELFKKAAKTNRKNTLKYIKLFASEHPTLALVQAYNHYMGKYATDTNAVSIQKNIDYNYKAWLAKVTDPNGPIKLTREDTLKYFNEYKAEAVDNN